jgi:prepilin-type N-terminal cleavage/methylation domain-containing protein
MRKAVTLAEVLITLGIIGVVAALTIPALVAGYKKQVVVVRLQKLYTVMNQAINMSIAENGDYLTWCRTYFATADEAKEYFEEYIGKYLKTLKIENIDNRRIFVNFPDGSCLAISKNMVDTNFFPDSICYKPGAIDYRFVFRVPEHAASHKKYFEPYDYGWDGTRAQLVTGCDDGYATFCTKLIHYDGWKISDDYPVKF